MTNVTATDWALATEQSGFSRHFGGEALPVTIGGDPADDIHLDAVAGSVQIGRLDDVFFVQPGRDTTNVRVGGAPVKGSRKLADGDVIALDSARLTCRFDDGKLRLVIEGHVTAGDTAPPDLTELARGTGRAGEVEIQPISFEPAAADAADETKRPSKTTVAVVAAFAVLAVLGWFAFTAKAVQLQFKPGAEEVSLPGTWFKLRVGDRFLLRTGTHRVVATLAGYYPLDTEIDVGRSPDQSIELTLTKLPGLVTLTTTPEAGAEVSLDDGAALGTTPLKDVEIRPGKHRLAFTAKRYLTEVRELDVEGGHVKQSLDVELTPNWAPVSLTTQPAGAAVTVDGEPAGETPLVMQLTAGEREVEARLPGYNAWHDTVVVNADEPQQLPPVTLTQADGRVALRTTPAEAAVNVDGEFRGRTPLTLRLRPGKTHDITLTKPGYETATRKLSVEADSGRRLDVELKALYGEIEIASEPAGAEIRVDGKSAGTTPDTLKLTALEHEIEIRRDGFAPQSRKLTPRPGFAQSLQFELEALDEATGSGYPRVIRTSLGAELRLIPAGKFMMGSSRREQGRLSSEVMHEVTLTQAFYLGVREVSNAEFKAFMADHDSGRFGEQSLDGDDQPVVRVTWEEAVQFLNWLSIKDGLQPVYDQTADSWAPVMERNGYRLPTEAEWAWAARAAGRDSILKYPWGDALPPPDRSGNYADLAAAKLLPTHLVTYNDAFPVSAPSGSFDANEMGIYDLGGNVAEWVQDLWTLDPEILGQQSTDPLGPKTGRFHVVRGSSWRSATVTELRLAYRSYASAGREDLGFRLARNLE